MDSGGVLREVVQVRQIAGENRRRWFSSTGMDLVVWYDSGGNATAFQLCYDKTHRERALTWQAGQRGVVHSAVDDGESLSFNYKATPILVPQAEWQPAQVLADFQQAAGELPPDLLRLVSGQLA